MSRLRVGIVALSRLAHGGVFQYTQSVIDALAGRSDLEVSVLTDHDEYDLRGLERRSLAARSLPRRLATAALLVSGVRSKIALPPADRSALAGLDLLFATSGLVYPHLFAGPPFVVTMHDLQERHLPGFFTPFERTLRSVINRGLAKRATLLLCESRFVAADLQRFLAVPERRIAVVPAPPLEQGAPPTDEEVAQVRSVHQLNENYLIYPAQFWPHKNHSALLRAFALLRPRFSSLRLAFTGAHRLRYPEVMAEARGLGLEQSVRALGQLPYAQLRALLRGARALVLPTLFESISIPILEAFALGVPVCSSNVVGLPEQVGDAGLLFDPRDPAQIAAAAERILTDPELAAELVRRGRARLAGNSRERFGALLAEVFRQVAVSSGGVSSSGVEEP